MRLLTATLAAGALALSGCVSQLVETNPPKPRYMVGALDSAAVDGPSVDWSLVIEDPGVALAYDTTKLAVSPRPGRIEYFGGGEWAGRAPRIFQTALVETFENSGRILAVGDRDALPVGDLVLRTDIRRIDLDVSNGGSTARIDVYARLGNGRAKIFAARRFVADAPAASLDGDDVAEAFDAAIKEAIAELVAWTFAEGEAARAATGA